jgi:hypothetical protein
MRLADMEETIVFCRVLKWFLFAFGMSTLASTATDFNAVVLRQIGTMPTGGGYATTTAAHSALTSSAQIGPTGVSIRPESAVPSYCSGATYLVFLKTLGDLQKSGKLSLTRSQWEALLPAPMSDGHGLWGRWNANGPGTARLFHELGLGRNFTSLADARPGDFLKIFWTDAVGKNERGHSVIFLGTEPRDGVASVQFWSSNKPGGYGEKSVARTKIARMLFSRLESPQAISALEKLPESDRYLASLLKSESSFREACALSGAIP